MVILFGLCMLVLALVTWFIEWCLYGSDEWEPTSTPPKSALRTLLRICMRVFAGLAFVCLFGFVLILLVTEAIIRVVGMRRRSKQAELLWILAIAVKSGRPLDQEVEIYAEGTWGNRRKKLQELALRLRHGESLEKINDSLNLLPQSAVLQIYSGISSKALQDSLSANAIRLTQEMANDHEEGSYSIGLAYPVALLMVIAFINGFIMYYIMPKFKKIFDDFGTELPGMTVTLIRISDSFVNYWYIWLVPIMFGPMALVLLISYGEFYGWRDLLRIVFGQWSVRMYSQDVLRSLSLWTSKDQPLDDALQTMIQRARSANLSRGLRVVQRLNSEGTPWWRALQQAGFVNRREADLLESAQHTGNVPWALDVLAQTIDDRRLYRLRTLMEIYQPMALIVVALGVGFVVISIFLPLIKLLNDLS